MFVYLTCSLAKSIAHTPLHDPNHKQYQWNASPGASPHTSQRAVGRKGSLTQKVEPTCSALLASVSLQASLFASMRLHDAFALIHSAAVIPTKPLFINQNALHDWMMHYREQCLLWINWIMLFGVCAFQSIERSSNGLQMMKFLVSATHCLVSSKSRTKQILQNKSDENVNKLKKKQIES